MVTLMSSTVHEQRARSAVRVGSCCARAVRLLAFLLGHQFVSFPNHAVAVAVIVTCYRQFPSILYNQFGLLLVVH